MALRHDLNCVSGEAKPFTAKDIFDEADVQAWDIIEADEVIKKKPVFYIR